VKQISVSAGEDTEADFGIPDPATLYAQWCSGVPMSDTLGVVLGIVRDTGDTKASGAIVRVEWTTITRQGVAGLRTQPTMIETTVSTRGRYAICGIPAGVRYTIRARRDRNGGAAVQSPMTRGEVRRVDLTLRAP